ncbi:MAG: hypothetical protein JXA28_03700 [Bacteroidetes bacterium]|nr:hypothetical protein [Bacteroidota bacterium]
MISPGNKALTPDKQTAREIFDRNIANSMAVTNGAFEEVLADIIEQLEHPPRVGDRYLTAWILGRRIAEALAEGFAGLPPNGFDFACWLWEAAPLHVVTIPQANAIGTSHGFRYGVIHLRKIAAMVAGTYVLQQPQKAPSVIELIDMSVDWVDARNLITYALVDHYHGHFLDAYDELVALVRSDKRWRRLVPLGVAARILGMEPALSSRAYGLVRDGCRHIGDPYVFDALRYVLRVAGMYGDQQAMLEFLGQLDASAEEGLRLLVCDFIRNPRLRWDRLPHEQFISLLTQWKREGDGNGSQQCLDEALAKLSLARTDSTIALNGQTPHIA